MSNISDFFKEKPAHLGHTEKEPCSPFGYKQMNGIFQSSPALDGAKPSQTGALKGKILCWNSNGMVKMIKNEENQSTLPSYEYVILSGKGTNYNQIKLVVNTPYEIASLSTTVVVLGRLADQSTTSCVKPINQFTCITFKKWTKQYSWDGHLPFGESLKAAHTAEQFIVLISTQNVAYVYTLSGFLVCKWSLCGFYVNGATFGDDIFSVACTLNDNAPHIIDTYVYRIGVDLLLLAKSSLHLYTTHDQLNTYTFTNEGILTVVTKLQFFYYSIVNQNVWCLYGRSSFEYGDDFIGISNHIVNHQIKMRCYIPSIIHNYEQYNLLDYKEVIFETLVRFNTENNYVNVIQNEILFEDMKSKHNRFHLYEESTIEKNQQEDILLDLFLYALKSKLEILAIDIFMLLKHPQNIKTATESASLSNQPRIVCRIGEILQKRKETFFKSVDTSNVFECEIEDFSTKWDKKEDHDENILLDNKECREILRRQRYNFKHSPPSKLKEINIDVATGPRSDPKKLLRNLLQRKK